ncbi:hypothetical protein IJ847_01385 [Candidatus Saccharibacteria bacterium]|nr:hypothetical protein [Candidatus Saccharibacteria bacterium]
MFLDDDSKIPSIVLKSNFVIIELPPNSDHGAYLPKAQRIQPANDKKEINIDSIRELSNITRAKQDEDLIIVAEHAEYIGINAANAFLKALEEPNDKIHYVFLTEKISEILPTIRSRAQIFYLPSQLKISDPPQLDEKSKAAARDFISANPKKLCEIADKIAKLKDSKREAALKLVSDAILLSYKSYFITGNEKLLSKLEKLSDCYDALSSNGNIRLQLIAHML